VLPFQHKSLKTTRAEELAWGGWRGLCQAVFSISDSSTTVARPLPLSSLGLLLSGRLARSISSPSRSKSCPVFRFVPMFEMPARSLMTEFEAASPASVSD